jgi:integrase
LETFQAVEQTEQLALFDSGSIDIAKLRTLGEKLQTGPRSAPLTTRGYAADWRMFTAWCERLGRSSLPASADTVWLYVTSMLVERKCKASTATRHVSSILHHHRVANLPIPSRAKVQGLLADVKRDRHERYEGKRALTPRDLARMCAACDGATNTGARDRALLVLGFATSMRRSELSALDLSDVTFESKGVAILIRKSKTDQAGRGRLIAVWPGAKPETDPVELLRAWIKRRGSWAGPLFSRIEGGFRFDELRHERIGGESINKVLKRALKRIGLDPKPYGAHSLRAGAVTAAAELGRSDQEIMALSGHRSADVMRQYVRRARVFDGRNPLAGVL